MTLILIIYIYDDQPNLIDVTIYCYIHYAFTATTCIPTADGVMCVSVSHVRIQGMVLTKPQSYCIYTYIV